LTSFNKENLMDQEYRGIFPGIGDMIT